jgi:hypothetical protein
MRRVQKEGEMISKETLNISIEVMELTVGFGDQNGNATKALSELRELRNNPTCKWTKKEEGLYQSECGYACCIWNNHSLEANHYNYCPNCGKRVEVVG